MISDSILLDMLGSDLGGAVIAARTRTGDASVMCRIEVGVCIVSRGDADLQGGLSHVAAVAYLAALN